MAKSTPRILRELVRRYDPSVFELGRSSARIRLEGAGPTPTDVVLDGRTAKLEPARRKRADALLSADPDAWRGIVEDLRGGMAAYQSGRLRVRRDLHLGVGFLAATADAGEGGLRLRHVGTDEGPLSVA